MAEELSSESNYEICCISTLLFLHFAGKNEHLCCGVLNFKLDRDGLTSLRMVAASEVTKVLSIWLTTIFFRPKVI